MAWLADVHAGVQDYAPWLFSSAPLALLLRRASFLAAPKVCLLRRPPSLLGEPAGGFPGPGARTGGGAEGRRPRPPAGHPAKRVPAQEAGVALGEAAPALGQSAGALEALRLASRALFA